jgi:hypothetical protein
MRLLKFRALVAMLLDGIFEGETGLPFRSI